MEREASSLRGKRVGLDFNLNSFGRTRVLYPLKPMNSPGQVLYQICPLILDGNLPLVPS